MATTIQIKRSATGTDAPSLAYGELAYSFQAATNKLWIGPSSGDAVVVGGKYYTDLFKTTTTDGKNETGKLLMTDSTNGHLLMEAKNITNVADLHSATIGVGTNATPELEITGNSLVSTGNLTIDGSAGNLILNSSLGSRSSVKD